MKVRVFYHDNCFDGVARCGVKSAINDVGPVNEVGNGAGIEAETFFGNFCDEAGAGLKCGIVKLAVAAVAFKMRGILRREKGAFMVVEPPGDFWRTGILEIYNGIFIAIEIALVKEGPGAVQQAAENKLNVIAYPLPVKTREQRGGGSAVEAFVMVKNTNFQTSSFHISFQPR